MASNTYRLVTSVQTCGAELSNYSYSNTLARWRISLTADFSRENTLLYNEQRKPRYYIVSIHISVIYFDLLALNDFTKDRT